MCADVRRFLQLINTDEVLGTHNLYGKGLGVTQDYAEAKRWYEKAAAAGFPMAMNNIGYLYDKGLGVTQDYAEAILWYEKAAAAGHSGAMVNLCDVYRYGRGVTKSVADARTWLCLS